MAPPDHPQPNAPTHPEAACSHALARLRAWDAELVRAQQAGELAYYSSLAGRAGALAAVAAAAQDTDWFAPEPRDALLALLRGADAYELASHFFGTAGDRQKGRQKPGHYGHRTARLLPVSGSHAAHLVHAVGFAWASLIEGKTGQVVFASYAADDEARGEFHNAANFAGVIKAPVVFLCHVDADALRSPARPRADARARAYGIRGGPAPLTLPRDIVALQAVIEAARSGRGPQLVDVTSVDQAGLGDAPPMSVEDRDAFQRAKTAGAPSRESVVQDVYGRGFGGSVPTGGNAS